MKTSYVILITALFALFAFVADKPAYQLYKAKGKKTDYDKLLQEAKNADIIFFGELHNNPIAHWLQLELARDLATDSAHKLVLGAEMFEADGQLLLNELLSGLVPERKFEEEMRLWKNHATDYRPLLRLAQTHRLHVVATNVPRRYASRVFASGFESLQALSPEAHNYMAPFPIAYPDSLACYRNMLQMGGSGGHANPNLPRAQALKDATMAHFILLNWKPGQRFLHLNGSYHSDFHQGIVWYIAQAKPQLKILTIATVEQDSIDDLDEEYHQQADFVLVVPSTMTKTH